MNNYYAGPEFNMENNVETTGGNETSVNMNTNHNCHCCHMNPCCPPVQNCCCPPIYECPRENVCHKVINYDVPHIIPCNTKVINHHVYKHTYTPTYTSCEEDVISNVYDNRCC